MIRGLVAAAAAALAWGCVRGSIPATELYRITSPRAENGSAGPVGGAATPVLQGALAVVPYVTPGIYGGRNIIYRVGEHGYGSYPYREWAIPLSDMLGMLTQRRLSELPLASGPVLYDPSAPRAAEYLWRGTVREFEESDRDQQVFAAVAIDVQLVRASDNAVLWTGSRRAERLVPESRSMPSVVATLSELTTESIDALISEARGALATSAARTTP